MFVLYIAHYSAMDPQKPITSKLFKLREFQNSLQFNRTDTEHPAQASTLG